MLINLLKNSLENIEKGYIIIKVVNLEGKNKHSNILKFTISDSGKGFENEYEKV